MDSAADPSLITQVSHRAMATEFVVMLPAHQAHAVESAVSALDELEQMEAAWTIFQPTSEISRINQAAVGQPVTVSATTFALLQRARLWSQRTQGAFDITAGALVEAWGFTRRRGRKPTREEIDAALAKVGYQHLQLDAQRSSVSLAREGLSLNVGGIGKGQSLDRMKDRLLSEGVTDFLIHGGNSSVIAAGDHTAGSGKGWAIGISHPTKPNRRIAGLWLRDAALATSGSGKQFFHHRGRRYGHVIDPRTGYPAGELLALTVIMDSAADADACSTGLFVAGHQSLCPDDWQLPAMLAVSAGNRQDEVKLETSGEIEWVEV